MFAHPEVAKIILLNAYDRDVVVKAFRSGARGLFCFSQHPFRLLCKCIQSVHQGQVWANSEQMQYLVEVLSGAFAPYGQLAWDQIAHTP